MMTVRNLPREPRLSLYDHLRQNRGVLLSAVALLCIDALTGAHDAWLAIGIAGVP